jgi:hypothetical protein
MSTNSFPEIVNFLGVRAVVSGIDLFHGSGGHCVAWQNPRNPHMHIGWLVNENHFALSKWFSFTQSGFQIHVRSAFWIAPLATEQAKPTDDVRRMSFTNHPMRMCGFQGFCQATQ